LLIRCYRSTRQKCLCHGHFFASGSREKTLLKQTSDHHGLGGGRRASGSLSHGTGAASRVAARAIASILIRKISDNIGPASLVRED
jgi:hypothetical protein